MPQHARYAEKVEHGIDTVRRDGGSVHALRVQAV